jgi:flagellar protein FlaJ
MRPLAAETPFERLETRRTLARTKKFRPGEPRGPEGQPHLVRLPKGAKPVQVSLKPFEGFAWRTMGAFVQDHYKEDQELEDNLLKAHINLRPEEYLAVAWMMLTIVAVASVIAAFVVGVLFFALAVPLFTLMTLSVALAVVPTLLVYAAYFGLPGGVVYGGLPAARAKARGRKIDKKITGAMSFVSAMASADVPVDVIFKELSRQEVYGEVAKEAEWITRDTELLGVDILTAIRQASIRSPSSKFQDFLQGVVTTSTSGGQLKPYFLLKAEQFEKEDRLEMRRRMETLGMLAESFVTVVVAFPLFLVVIMAIMALISKTAESANFVIQLLYVVVALMIPISQFGFIFVIWNMEQEA